MMLSPVMRGVHWLPLVLTIAGVQAAMISLPSMPPPAGGPCQQALKTVEDRLVTLQAGLESASEALLALRLTFDSVFQLLNLENPKLPVGSGGYDIDSHENATVIEVVTLGPTDEGRREEGRGLSSDDEDLDVNFEVDIELEQNTSSEDGNKDKVPKPEGSGLPSDDEDLGTKQEGSGLSSDDEDLGTKPEGSGLSSDDEDLGTKSAGSGYPSYDYYADSGSGDYPV